jgi:hypothetical protein
MRHIRPAEWPAATAGSFSNVLESMLQAPGRTWDRLARGSDALVSPQLIKNTLGLPLAANRLKRKSGLKRMPIFILS